jgi:AbrB family looped-hinge helix DNA binding protein
MAGLRARISESGRLSIPAAFRKALGLDRGGNVVVELVGREIRIRTVDEVVAQAQTLARGLLGDRPEASVEAFLAERRRGAARE